MWPVFGLPQFVSKESMRILARAGISFSFVLAAAACNVTQDNTSQSNRAPDDLHYSINPAYYPIGHAISSNLLQSRTSLSNISITPNLPAGLSFNSANGTITGTPTTITPAQTYTVQASNGSGTGYVQLVLAVTDNPPTISYSGSTTVSTVVGSSVSISPTLGGGATTSCTSSPSLPAGLSLSSACVISGSPTAPVASTNYTISANNSGGSATLVFNFTIIDHAPIISAGGSYQPYRGFSMTPITVTNTGGAVTSCSVSPSLPAGLSLSNTCTISGTPTTISGMTSYTLTANNSSGTPSTANVSIQVIEAPPSISYSPNSAVLTVGTAMPTMTPSSLGGAISSCAIAPALPAGLSFNTSTCAISGTPTTPSSITTYTVTATNSTSTGTASVTLTVKDIPPSISYASSPYTYTVGTAVNLSASNSGGAATNCSITPSITGLGLSISSTCQITGTPTTVSAATNYTITATNSSGTPSSTSIRMTINDRVPVLSYSASPYTFTKGTSVGTKTPTNTGGTVTSCTVSPSLPTGLSLSSTCVITGTPTVVSASATYTITASNTGGSDIFTLGITVNDTLPVFSYSGTPYTWTRNSAITTQTPTNTGGAITSCAATPTLPAGISLSNTCVMTGTPTVAQSATTYTIQGTNSAGTASTSISIKVNEIIPVISYVGSPYTFTVNQAITTQTPNSTGGSITSCSSSPALPAGLSINNTTCAISGTPTATSSATSYTITATNGSGSGTASISITVNNTGPAINYIPTTYNFTYTKGTAIANLTPNNTGGAITSCAVSPTLPLGLSFNTTTCTISGTPTVVASAASYTITASNSGGTSSAVITITVQDTAPAFSYSGSPFTLTVNSALSAQTPTNTGGTITGCSSSPNLPAGITLSSTCVLSGTPTVVSSTAAYTITATNTGGSSTASVSITVNDIAPTLNYTGSPFTYTVGVAISSINPTLGGGAVVSCSSSPTLPAGLTISSGCVISGTPSAVTATANYTITATNTGGSANKVISITVNNGPPILSYTGSPFTYYRGVPITTLNPNNTGGAITSCSSSPALPAGLSLSSGCVLSGTPSGTAAAANYTITATNSKGSSNAVINVTVNDSAPLISFNPSSYVEVLRTAISTISPTNNGGAITSCTSSPTLPAGLSIASTTCAITGTPTATSSATTYTITATNSTGSSTTTLSIQVKNLPQILFYGYTALSGAFNSTIPGSQNIWKTSSDGVDRVALTSNSNSGLDSIYPAFSTDGTKVLNSSKRATNGSTNGTATSSANIWTSAADGTSPTILTSNTNAGLDSDDPPRFSPDGTKIVFASKTAINGSANGTASASYNIWIMNSDGTGKTALTQNTLSGLDSITPVFGPGGTVVYFASIMNVNGTMNGTASASYNIWKVNTDGTSLTRLTAETSATARDSLQPDVSPDGNTIVFVSRSKIGSTTPAYHNVWSMTSSGSSRTALTSNTSGSQDCQNPHFSPDGTKIIYSSMQNVYGVSSSSYNVFVMSSGGGTATALTSNTAASNDSVNPSFSPDGTQIVYSSLMSIGSTSSSSYNIWVANSDGTGATNLTANTSAGRDSYLGPGNVWYAQ